MSSVVHSQARRYGPSNKSGGDGLRTPTPYDMAMSEHDRRMGGLVMQARSWRSTCLLLTGLLGISTVGNVYLGQQPKLVPHIIEVDALGQSAYRGPVAAMGQSKPNAASVRALLVRFIKNLRSLSSDPYIVTQSFNQAYHWLTPRAANKLKPWVIELDPQGRRENGETRTVEILSAVPTTEFSWIIDWEETKWSRSGEVDGLPVKWRATLTTVHTLPKSEEELRVNHLGIRVDDFAWETLVK